MLNDSSHDARYKFDCKYPSGAPQGVFAVWAFSTTISLALF